MIMGAQKKNAYCIQISVLLWQACTYSIHRSQKSLVVLLYNITMFGAFLQPQNREFYSCTYSMLSVWGLLAVEIFFTLIQTILQIYNV